MKLKPVKPEGGKPPPATPSLTPSTPEKREGAVYTTAELARAAGVTRRTVMHYAELELLPPDQVTASGRALYNPYSLRLLRDLMDMRALGMTLEEARDMVTLRRATHDPDGTYRRDWTREDVPIGDERLQALHARLRLVNDAYARQAENLARFDRWLSKRFTGEPVRGEPPTAERRKKP